MNKINLQIIINKKKKEIEKARLEAKFYQTKKKLMKKILFIIFFILKILILKQKSKTFKNYLKMPK
jgi:hypothetical protein